MKISLTGGTGFLGSSFLKKVKSNKKIKLNILNRKTQSLFDKDSLQDFLKNSDVVVHLAGVSRSKSTEEIRKVNVDGTKNLLEAVHEYSPKAKFIFASSFQIYQAKDPFGKSKKEAEKLIEKYREEKGISAVILRFSNLYGIGGKPFHNSVINTFVSQIKNNELLTLDGEGKQKRDFLYITDAVEAIFLTSMMETEQRVFDICTGKLTSLVEVVDILKNFTKRKIEVYNSPLDVKISFSNTRSYEMAREYLGWSPKIDLTSGIKKLVDEYEL